jgi:hypothetical protein
VPKGHVLVREGETVEYIYILVAGEVSLTKNFNTDHCLKAFDGLEANELKKLRKYTKSKKYTDYKKGKNCDQKWADVASNFYTGIEIIDSDVLQKFQY